MGTPTVEDAIRYIVSGLRGQLGIPAKYPLRSLSVRCRASLTELRHKAPSISVPNGQLDAHLARHSCSPMGVVPAPQYQRPRTGARPVQIVRDTATKALNPPYSAYHCALNKRDDTQLLADHTRTDARRSAHPFRAGLGTASTTGRVKPHLLLWPCISRVPCMCGAAARSLLVPRPPQRMDSEAYAEFDGAGSYSDVGRLACAALA